MTEAMAIPLGNGGCCTSVNGSKALELGLVWKQHN